MSKFDTGQRVKILSCKYGGFGDSFFEGDIGIIMKPQHHAGDTIEVAIGEGMFAFAPEDLEIDNVTIRSKPDEMDEKVKEIAQCCSKILHNKAQYIREERCNLVREQRRLQNRMGEIIAKVAGCNVMLRSCVSKANSTPVFANMYRQVDALLKDKYTDFRVENAIIVGDTTQINIPYNPGKGIPELNTTYELGKYKVSINVATKEIHIKMIDDNMRGGYAHPHISDDGEVCLGTYSTMIYESISEDKYMDAFALLHEFLSSVTDDDWYNEIFHWHKDQDLLAKICWKCLEAQDDCECREQVRSWCDDCDNDYDDCTCTKCPDTGERLQDNSFPDAQCMRCASCARNTVSSNWECRYAWMVTHQTPLTAWQYEREARDNYIDITEEQPAPSVPEPIRQLTEATEALTGVIGEQSGTIGFPDIELPTTWTNQPLQQEDE